MTKWKVCVLIIVVLILIVGAALKGLQFLLAPPEHGDGYKYSRMNYDRASIYRNGETIVPPTIIDLTIIPEYLVGLRLPIENLECGGGYKTRFINREEYFILNSDTGDIFNFTSKQPFEAKLKELNIFKDVSLDYTTFKTRWDHKSMRQSRIDYSQCTLLPNQTGTGTF